MIEGLVLAFLSLFFILPAVSSSLMYKNNNNMVVVYSSLTLFGDLVELFGLFMIFPAVLLIPAVYEGDLRARLLSALGFTCFVLALLSPCVIAIRFGAFSTDPIYLLKVEGIYNKIFSLASKYCGSHTLDCISLLKEMTTSSPTVQPCSRMIYHNVAFRAYMLNFTCVFKRLSTVLVAYK